MPDISQTTQAFQQWPLAAMLVVLIMLLVWVGKWMAREVVGPVKDAHLNLVNTLAGNVKAETETRVKVESHLASIRGTQDKILETQAEHLQICKTGSDHGIPKTA